MDKVEGKGDSAAPVRKHLERLAKKGHSEAIEALDGPEFPEVLDYLLVCYEELAVSRSVGMSGMNPISYSDIMAWSALLDYPLEPYEVSGIIALDSASRFPGKLEDDDDPEERVDASW